jgi:hypothetical protein
MLRTKARRTHHLTAFSARSPAKLSKRWDARISARTRSASISSGSLCRPGHRGRCLGHVVSRRQNVLTVRVKDPWAARRVSAHSEHLSDGRLTDGHFACMPDTILGARETVLDLALDLAKQLGHDGMGHGTWWSPERKRLPWVV